MARYPVVAIDCMAADRGTLLDARASIADSAWPLTRTESVLWAVALLAMALDTLLTYRGLQAGLTEGNPVVRAGFRTVGFGALPLLKLLAVGIGLVGRALVPARTRSLVPVGLAVPSAIAAAINAVLLFGTGP